MRKKVLAVASAGGHWVQLQRLSDLFSKYETHYVTTNVDLKPQDLPAGRFHVVPDANAKGRIKLAWCLLSITWALLIVRPSVVISTGAAPGFLAVVIGKALGAKTIWIDSVANCDELSLSGRKVGRWADLWLTQWPHLARAGGPDYRGSVL